MKPISLRKRFFVHTVLVALAIMMISALLIDVSYRKELELASQEKLKLHVFNLLSVAEYQNKTLQLPLVLTNPGFNTEQGDLWAIVLNNENSPIWQSLSLAQIPKALPKSPAVGQWQFDHQQVAGIKYITTSYAINWEGKETFQLIVAENSKYLNALIQGFRIWLLLGFLVITIALLSIQLWVLKLAFRPIDQLENEIACLEKGEQARLKENYPLELAGVSRNLNALIEKEYSQREKYRASMADLAHSLKTPVAIIKAELTSLPDNPTLNDALTRINDTIEYQLRRAVISGHNLLSKGTDIKITLELVLTALEKIYQAKMICVQCEVDSSLHFPGDENDLMEIFGNLLDNAFKHAQQNIKIKVSQSQRTLEISVEDDGAGIPEKQATTIFNRGKRLDESNSGQGLGLAIVQNIVLGYHGHIVLTRSPMDGAKFTLSFPIRTY